MQNLLGCEDPAWAERPWAFSSCPSACVPGPRGSARWGKPEIVLTTQHSDIIHCAAGKSHRLAESLVERLLVR